MTQTNKPMDERMANIQLLRMLGFNFDPLANANSLVDLINKSEDMPFKREMFEKQHGLDKSRLDLEGRRVTNDELRSANQVRIGDERTQIERDTLGVREKAIQSQEGAQEMSMLMNLLGLGIEEGQMGTRFSPLVNEGVMGEIAGGLGFADFFKPGQKKPSGKRIKDLNGPRMDEALRKNGVQGF
jgi:hypothetical protein